MSTLKYIERCDEWSVYETQDGTEVLVAHGFPRRILVEYDFDWVMQAWRVRPSTYNRYNDRSTFLDMLRNTLTEPEIVDDLRFCTSCEEPSHTDDGYTVEGDEFACDSCVSDHFYSCYDCDVYARETNSTLHDESVCEWCLNNRYSYCEECDGYYNNDYSSDHEHESGMCCESPAPRFTVPNDGNGPLRNDEITTVSLPAGTISEEGMNEIYRYVENTVGYSAAAVVYDIGATVQTKEGNFTKRLSRALWKAHTIKIEAGVLSQVGNIASAHSAAVSHQITVSRELNQSASDWGHAESCYWQSYYRSRCTLKTNGGFGIRSWDDYGRVTGRSWVMPMRKVERPTPTTTDIRRWAKNVGFTVKDSGPLTQEIINHYNKRNRTQLVPTFDAQTADAYIVFNGYGRLSDYTPARIMAYMAGMTYRKVGFSATDLYVNAGGYLIAPEELASEYTDGSLDLSTDSHSNLFRTEQAALNAAAAALISDKELVNA